MANAYRDENDVTTIIASSSVDGKTPVRVYADPSTHRLLVDASGGGTGTVSEITDGSTTVLNPTTIDFMSGATVTNLGSGVAGVAISGGGGTPGSPTTSVQFNNAGSFAGDASFTFVEDGDVKFLNLGVEGSTALIVGPDSVTPDVSGGTIVIQTGAGLGDGSGGSSGISTGAGGTEGGGGDLNFFTGSGGDTSGNAGNINLTAGAGLGGDSSGGSVTIIPGSSSGANPGGPVQIGSPSYGRGGETGDGSSVSIFGGLGGTVSGSGGSLLLAAGSAVAGTSSGGGVTIQAGNSSGNSTGNGVNIQAGIGGPGQTSGGVQIYGGDGEGTTTGSGGGNVNIYGGSGLFGDSNGGDVSIIAGAISGSANKGIVTLQSDDASVYLKVGGDISIEMCTATNFARLTTNSLTGDRLFNFPDQAGIFSTVTSGTSVPGSTPGSLGQIYVKTDTSKVYISTGTSSSADWTIIN